MKILDVVIKYMMQHNYSQLVSKKKDCHCCLDASSGRALFHCLPIMRNCSFYFTEKVLDYLFPADIGEISIRKLVRKFMKINGLVGLVESKYDPDCGCSIKGDEGKLFECGYMEYPKEIYCKVIK